MQIFRSWKIFFFFIIFFSFCFSQSNNLYYHKTPDDIRVGEQIEISQLLFTDLNVEIGMLYFRNKGELSYQEVLLTNSQWFLTSFKAIDSNINNSITEKEIVDFAYKSLKIDSFQ